MLPKPGSTADKICTFLANSLEICVTYPMYMALDETVRHTKRFKGFMEERLRTEMIKHLGGSCMSIAFARNAIKKGADPNTEGGRFTGESLIVAATRYHLPKFVEVLADAGADTADARKTAEKKGFTDIIAILDAAKPAAAKVPTPVSNASI